MDIDPAEAGAALDAAIAAGDIDGQRKAAQAFLDGVEEGQSAIRFLGSRERALFERIASRLRELMAGLEAPRADP